MGPTLVFGHRNPDIDSICSAVAYAHLKNVIDAECVYVPGRLGPMPPEALWVFAEYGVGPPDLIEHVRLRARDVMETELATVGPDASLLEAGRAMQERDVRALPVMDGERAAGLITTGILASKYMEDMVVSGFSARPVRVSRLVSVLDGELLVGDADAELSGDVLIGAMEPDTMRGYLKEGDTLIVGDRRRTQPMALEAGIACLVATGGHLPDEEVLESARRSGAAIVVTPRDTYGAARLIELSDCAGDVMDTDIVRVAPDALLSEVSEDLFSSPQREALVEDDEGRLLGLITRTSIATAEPRRVVLVDHNEIAQSALGIEDACVVEIVDHHRVGDVQTHGPALFLGLPVGATATIVATRYGEAGIEPPEGMAALMLAAILSDTVLLKSPTATDLDREVASGLAAALGADLTEFGLALFSARSSHEPFSAERTILADLKEYRLGEVKVAIAQAETVALADVMEHADEISAAMETHRTHRDYDLFLLMVTDVVREGSELLATGRTRLAERALGVSFEAGSAWMPGVLSRKKQVAALLADAARR